MRAPLIVASILTTTALHNTDFQAQLSLLQNAAAGAPPPQDSFPHARSTSKFGEILWRANDATRAHDALEALGSNPLATATASAYGILAALESPELVERRQSARSDLLTPKRSPDFEGVLLWECADAISKAAPALACDDHVGVLYALALARAALSARGHGADARRLERAVAKHFHALPRETKGDVAYDLVAADDIRRSPRWDGNDERRARAKTVLVAFAGLGSRGHVGYEWRGAAHRVKENHDFIPVALATYDGLADSTDPKKPNVTIPVLSMRTIMTSYEHPKIDVLRLKASSNLEWKGLKNLVNTGTIQDIRQLSLNLNMGDPSMWEEYKYVLTGIRAAGFLPFYVAKQPDAEYLRVQEGSQALYSKYEVAWSNTQW